MPTVNCNTKMRARNPCTYFQHVQSSYLASTYDLLQGRHTYKRHLYDKNNNPMRREGIKTSQMRHLGAKEDKSHNEEIVKHKYFNLLLKANLWSHPILLRQQHHPWHQWEQLHQQCKRIWTRMSEENTRKLRKEKIFATATYTSVTKFCSRPCSTAKF